MEASRHRSEAQEFTVSRGCAHDVSVFVGFSFLEGKAQRLFRIFFGFTAPVFAAGGSAVTQDAAQPGLRSKSYSMGPFFMMLSGYSLSPVFIGFPSDRSDPLTAFRFLPLFAPGGAAAFFIGSPFYAADPRGVEAVMLQE